MPKPSPYPSPTSEQIKARRVEAKLTQEQAAKMVSVTRGNWTRWEAGSFKMHPGLWRLFLIETMKEPY